MAKKSKKKVIKSVSKDKFTLLLATNDKSVRLKALKVLRNYLSHRTEMTLMEMLQLWKGLHVCMWLQDQKDQQLDLADRIGRLMTTVPDELFASWWRAFLLTMGREWKTLDLLRIDKYMMFVRRCIRSALIRVYGHLLDDKEVQIAGETQFEWSKDLAKIVGDTLADTALQPDLPMQTSSLGLALHIADVFVEEIVWVSATYGSEPSLPVLLHLWEPFFLNLERCKDKILVKRIAERVFYPFIEQVKHEEFEDAGCRLTAKDLSALKDRMFALASAENTWKGNRGVIYSILNKVNEATVRENEEEESMEDEPEKGASPSPVARRTRNGTKRKRVEVKQPGPKKMKKPELAVRNVTADQSVMPSPAKSLLKRPGRNSIVPTTPSTPDVARGVSTPGSSVKFNARKVVQGYSIKSPPGSVSSGKRHTARVSAVKKKKKKMGTVLIG